MRAPASLSVDSSFDGGNFVTLGIAGDTIRGSIARDPVLGCCQWFCFTVTSDRPLDVSVRIDDADRAVSSEAWRNYMVCVRHEADRGWSRRPTIYSDGVLRFSHSMREGSTSFAYFEPYPLSRYDALHARIRRLPVEHGEIMVPLARGLPAVAVYRLAGHGRNGGRRRVWIIGRQHPGEVAAAWFIEALCSVLEVDDGIRGALLDAVELFLVPNMNPGGVALGLHRTNEKGLDLNRQWLASECEAVRGVRALMAARPPHVFLDVHGDEAALFPYLIVNDDQGSGEACPFRLGAPWQRTCGSADMSLARNFAQKAFGCAAATLEIPTQHNVGGIFDQGLPLLDTMSSLARDVTVQLLEHCVCR